MGTRIIGMRFAATGLLLLCAMMPMPAATITVTNTDPLLGPLQDNGGPTLTHALLPGSPAINAGDPNFTPPPLYDQRGPGFDRIVSGRIDKGSFEVQGPSATPTVTPTPTATSTPRATATPTVTAI